MNITERNIWKLNNLPPMEYCSLARAQKLLNCELEDILHWHDIGAINLCLKLNPTPGILKIAVLSHQEKEVTSAFNPFTSVGNDSNLLIVFYVQIMPDDLVMQLHRF